MRVLARLLTLTLLFIFTIPSCKEGDAVLIDPPADGVGTAVDVVSPYMPPDPSTYVCNPFDDSNVGNRSQGLVGSLYYTLPGETHYTKAEDYVRYAHPVNEVNLFFNQLNVPTRPFDRGFVTQSGEVISTPQGNTLYEYFGIRFKAHLVLDEADPQGLYEFAVLSDDGAVLRMQDSSGAWQTIVNNDGVHATRMGCAKSPVDMKKGASIPFELDYYQGPRYHISLIVMWRPWTGGASDVSCGKEGNSLFFNSNVDPPAPQSAYQSLLTRGWQVVGPSHYRLEPQTQNPCNEPAPVIEDFVLSEYNSTGVKVTWLTSIAATGKVLVRNKSTGQELTFSKNGYAVSHTIMVTGLTPNTLYEVRVVSESSSGRSTTSDPVEFRTLR